MNNAYLYIRAKCSAKQGESKLLELATMTIGTGITIVEGDVVVEFDCNEEGKCLEDMKAAVKSGVFNVVIIDKLESISSDEIKAKKFVMTLMGLGAIVLIKNDTNLVLFQVVKNG